MEQKSQARPVAGAAAGHSEAATDAMQIVRPIARVCTINAGIGAIKFVNESQMAFGELAEGGWGSSRRDQAKSGQQGRVATGKPAYRMIPIEL